ncbi:MAG: MFS transporter [Gammaproteobacteria bacterium]|nr:MFS transporter [Gammaproteobacteria bacterium]
MTLNYSFLCYVVPFRADNSPLKFQITGYAYMFYGWKLLAGLSAIYFLAIGLTFSGVGVVLPPMVEEFGWSRAEVGLGFALIAMIYGLAGPIVARIIGKIGCRMTIFYGGFINAAGAIITCYTTSLWQFYFGAGLLMGVGMSMQTVIPGNQLIANWFHYRRSLALGIFLSIGGAGALSAIPASFYIDATGKWQHIWLAMAACTLLASVISFFVVREKPADLNQEVDGGFVPQASDENLPPKRSVHRTTDSWQPAQVLRTSSFWLIVIAGSASVMGATIVTSQLVLHLKDIGIDPVLAGSALGIQGAIGAGARLMAGILGDKFDPRRLLVIGLVGQFIGYYFLKIATDPIHVYGFVLTFGLGYGMAAVSSTSLVVNFFGVQSNARLMAVRGIIVTLVAGIGPVTAGYLADSHGNYSLAFSLYMGVSFISILAVSFMPIPVFKGSVNSKRDASLHSSG